MLIPPQASAESKARPVLIKIERQPNSKSSAKVAARGNGTCFAQPGQNNIGEPDRFHASEKNSAWCGPIDSTPTIARLPERIANPGG